MLPGSAQPCLQLGKGAPHQVPIYNTQSQLGAHYQGLDAIAAAHLPSHDRSQRDSGAAVSGPFLWQSCTGSRCCAACRAWGRCVRYGARATARPVARCCCGALLRLVGLQGGKERCFCLV